MNLIIFDIDGTILNSKAIDDALFIQSMKEVLDITLNDNDWSKFKNVTDEGICTEAYEAAKGRKITAAEKEKLIAHFYQLTKEQLQKHPEKFKPIAGVKKMMQQLEEQEEIAVGIATGGWERTAKLKLEQNGIDVENYSFSSTDDKIDRKGIMLNVIDKARNKEGERGFDRIISIGDGIWDLKTARELEISFIGVDANEEGKFKNEKVDLVIKDYTDNTTLLRYLLS